MIKNLNLIFDKNQILSFILIHSLSLFRYTREFNYGLNFSNIISYNQPRYENQNFF